MEGDFPNIPLGKVVRIQEGKEVFYYAHCKQFLSICLAPASQTIEHDIRNDKIINLLLYVKQDDEIQVYDLDEIEEILGL
jgi:hypothetical protein